MNEKIDEAHRVVQHAGTNTNDFREQMISIKTYCDLLLEAEQSSQATYVPKVQEASAADVQHIKQPNTGKETPVETSRKLNVYDDDEKPESDSLLDF